MDADTTSNNSRGVEMAAQPKIDAWCSRELVSSPQRAFHLGRMFNCFKFHLMQAFMLYGVGMSEDAEHQLEFASEFLAQLRTIGRLVSTSDADIFASSYAEITALLRSTFDSSSHQEQIDDLRKKMRALDENFLTRYARQEMIENAVPVLRRTRQILEEHIGEARFPIFELGELLDEGVRPADTLQRMFDPVKFHKAFAARELCQDCDIEGDGLANIPRRAGDLAPESHWESAVQILLTNYFGDGFPKLESVASSHAVIEFVDSIDGAVRRQLSITKKIPLMRVDVNRRIAIDPEGHEYPLAKLKHALFLQAVVEQQGDWVASSDIKKRFPGYGEFRPDRIVPKLPQALQDVLESESPKGTRLRPRRVT